MSTGRDEVEAFLALAERGFAREDEVLAGDGARVDRIESAVQQRYAARPVLRARRLVAAVSAGIFAAGVAFAAWRAGGEHDRTKPSISPAPVESEAARPLPAPVVSPLPTDLPRIESAPSARAAQAANGTAARAVARTSAPPTPASSGDPSASAASLFAAANAARVSGDTARAITLSQQLLTLFPRSSEAGSTHLSLGMLCLQERRAEDALAEFEAYEAQAGGDALAEAWWGKAQALRELGRTEEERATLSQLARRFPSSAYAAAARKRLAESR